VPRWRRRQIEPARPIQASSAIQGSVIPNRAEKLFRVLLGAVGGHVLMYSPGIKSRATRFVNFIEKPPPSASAGAEFTVPSFEFRTTPASANLLERKGEYLEASRCFKRIRRPRS
jgi:hypothetical protein